MYGEDIDISYRIQKSGFKITISKTIILQRESTKKSSINYVYIL